MNSDAVQREFNAMRPRVIELDAIDGLQDVGAHRRESNLENRCRVISEIGRAQPCEGSAEFRKSAENRFAVLDS